MLTYLPLSGKKKKKKKKAREGGPLEGGGGFLTEREGLDISTAVWKFPQGGGGEGGGLISYFATGIREGGGRKRMNLQKCVPPSSPCPT